MELFTFIDNYNTQLSGSKKHTGIYMLHCEINNAYYIGAAKNLRSRISNHKNSLKNNSHCNPWIQSVFNKYRCLKISILETFDFKDGDHLTKKEIYWIDRIRSKNPDWISTNIHIPVNTWNKKELSTEQFEKHRLQAYRNFTKTHKDKSWTKTPEHRNKMSNIFKGRKCTWKKKLKESRRKRPGQVYSLFYTIETPEKEIKTLQTWDSLSKFLKEYACINQIHFHSRCGVEKLIKRKVHRGFKVLQILRKNVENGNEIIKYKDLNFDLNVSRLIPIYPNGKIAKQTT